MNFIELTLGNEFYPNDDDGFVLVNRHHISTLFPHKVTDDICFSKIQLNNGKQIVVKDTYETIKAILEGKTDACK